MHVRDQLGERFAGGLLLNTGDEAQPIGDRIAVAPVAALWR